MYTILCIYKKLGKTMIRDSSTAFQIFSMEYKVCTNLHLSISDCTLKKKVDILFRKYNYNCSFEKQIFFNIECIQRLTNKIRIWSLCRTECWVMCATKCDTIEDHNFPETFLDPGVIILVSFSGRNKEWFEKNQLLAKCSIF